MKVAIIGAGGHGRVVYDCLRLVHGTEPEVVFYDDRDEARCQPVFGCRVAGPIDALEDDDCTHVFVAIGENRRRREVARRVLQARRAALRLIHPWTAISPHAEIGGGTIAIAGTVVNAGAHVGEHVILNTLCSVGHDGRVEDFAQIAPGVNLGGGAIVGTGAFLGIGAKVAPEVTIGAWAVIGAGSVVLDDVPRNAFAYGAPARVVRKPGAST